MSVFDFSKSRTWSLDALTPPWESDVSIYIYIRDNPKASGLPDDDFQWKPNELRCVEGALDGVLGRKEVRSQMEKAIRSLA